MKSGRKINKVKLSHDFFILHTGFKGDKKGV